MSNAWILVANSTQAKVFNCPGPLGPAMKVEELENELSKKVREETASSKRGRSFDRHGAGRHAMEPPTAPKEREQENFAHRVAKMLNQAKHKNQYKWLFIVASPEFLGKLRHRLNKNVLHSIKQEKNHDLTKEKDDKILNRFQQPLWFAGLD